VSFPAWALRRPDAPRTEPCQAVDEDGVVGAVNDPAAASGLRTGMRRDEAEARCPTVVTLERDPGREAILFEPVVAAVEALVPRVEVVHPGTMLVPLGGAVRYYGGEAPLVERVAKELTAVTGGGFRLGVAAGPFAATKAALLAAPDAAYVVEDDAAFLASLDVSELGAEDLAAVFRWLGVTTLGELAALPRPAIVARFGARGLSAHRLASGEDRPACPRPPGEDRSVVERFAPALDDVERAAFAGRAMANRLLDRLAEEGIAPFRVVVEMEAGDGTRRRRTWHGRDPFDARTLGERVRWQLRAWLEGGSRGIRGGIVMLRLEPGALSDEGRQLGMLERWDTAAIRRTLSEVEAVVGPGGVLRATPRGGRDPGERVRWRRWDEERAAERRDEAPWPGRIPRPSPALVPPEPQPVEIDWDAGMPVRVRLGSRWEPVLSWAGPWRRMGRWWQGEVPSDRYQIVTSAGAILCAVTDGAVFLIGVYD